LREHESQVMNSITSRILTILNKGPGFSCGNLSDESNEVCQAAESNNVLASKAINYVLCAGHFTLGRLKRGHWDGNGMVDEWPVESVTGSGGLHIELVNTSCTVSRNEPYITL